MITVSKKDVRPVAVLRMGEYNLYDVVGYKEAGYEHWLYVMKIDNSNLILGTPEEAEEGLPFGQSI